MPALEVTPVTLATSPIKIYEYLAMRKPVVVPNLPLLCSLRFAFPSSSCQEFLDKLQSARFIEVGGEKLDVFVRENSWEARVGKSVFNVRGGIDEYARNIDPTVGMY